MFSDLEGPEMHGLIALHASGTWCAIFTEMFVDETLLAK
jgi:hypothetical protein